MPKEQIDVRAYLPQDDPVVMIDRLLSTNERITSTELEILDDNILVENGHLSEAGIIENIAQTAALHAGYHRHPCDEVLIGFIGALKNLEIYRLPKVGSRLTTTIEILHQVMGATIIKGSSTCMDQPVAACEMKIFLQQTEND